MARDHRAGESAAQLAAALRVPRCVRAGVLVALERLPDGVDADERPGALGRVEDGLERVEVAPEPLGLAVGDRLNVPVQRLAALLVVQLDGSDGVGDRRLPTSAIEKLAGEDRDRLVDDDEVLGDAARVDPETATDGLEPPPDVPARGL